MFAHLRKLTLIYVSVAIVTGILGISENADAEERKTLLYYYAFNSGSGTQLFIIPEDKKGESTILINSGEGKITENVIGMLKKAGVNNIDLFVIDDIAGADIVFKNFNVKNVWAPKIEKDTNAAKRFMQIIKKNKTKAVSLKTGDIYTSRYASLRILAPSSRIKDVKETAFILTFGEVNFLVSSMSLDNLRIFTGTLPKADIVTAPRRADEDITYVVNNMTPLMVVFLSGEPKAEDTQILQDKTTEIRYLNSGIISIVTDGTIFFTNPETNN